MWFHVLITGLLDDWIMNTRCLKDLMETFFNPRWLTPNKTIKYLWVVLFFYGKFVVWSPNEEDKFDKIGCVVREGTNICHRLEYSMTKWFEFLPLLSFFSPEASNCKKSVLKWKSLWINLQIDRKCSRLSSDLTGNDIDIVISKYSMVVFINLTLLFQASVNVSNTTANFIKFV